jgi:hypothetical protein
VNLCLSLPGCKGNAGIQLPIHNVALICVSALRCSPAGSRPGRRVTFLLYDKKVTKETYPATSALRATRRCEAGNGRSRKLACGSDTRSRTAPFPASHQRLGGRGFNGVSRPAGLRLAAVNRVDQGAVSRSLCELFKSHQSRRVRKSRRGKSGGACLSRRRVCATGPARLSQRGQPVGPAKLGLLLCLLSCRSKKVGRLPGRVPAPRAPCGRSWNAKRG